MKKIYVFLLTLMLFITGCGPTTNNTTTSSSSSEPNIEPTITNPTTQTSPTTTYTEPTSQNSYNYGDTIRLGDVFAVFDVLSTQDINFFARENYQENDTHLAIISKEYMTDVTSLYEVLETKDLELKRVYFYDDNEKIYYKFSLNYTYNNVTEELYFYYTDKGFLKISSMLFECTLPRVFIRNGYPIFTFRYKYFATKIKSINSDKIIDSDYDVTGMEFNKVDMSKFKGITPKYQLIGNEMFVIKIYSPTLFSWRYEWDTITSFYEIVTEKNFQDIFDSALTSKDLYPFLLDINIDNLTSIRFNRSTRFGSDECKLDLIIHNEITDKDELSKLLAFKDAEAFKYKGYLHNGSIHTIEFNYELNGENCQGIIELTEYTSIWEYIVETSKGFYIVDISLLMDCQNISNQYYSLNSHEEYHSIETPTTTFTCDFLLKDIYFTYTENEKFINYDIEYQYFFGENYFPIMKIYSKTLFTLQSEEYGMIHYFEVISQKDFTEIFDTY